MPESIISPDVKTREVDQSFIPPADEERTALVIGPTTKGNFFTPQRVTQQNFNSKLGIPNQENLKEYTSLTAYNFLRGGADSVNVMPVTNVSGEEMGTSYVLTATIGTTEYEFLQLFESSMIAEDDTKSITSITVDTSTTPSDTLEDLTVTVEYDDDGSAVSVDILSEADLTNQQELINFYERFRNGRSQVNPVFVKSIMDVNAVASDHGEADIGTSTVSLTESASAVSVGDYTNPESPWVLSQDGDRLFKLHSLVGSDIANRSLRVNVTNIKTPDEVGSNSAYGEFTIELYSYVTNNLINDSERSRTDTEQLLESFIVSLDPDADNYIEKEIGNRREYFNETESFVDFDGIYANQSEFVRVEMSSTFEADAIPSGALPWGFERYDLPIEFFGEKEPNLYSPASASKEGGIDFNNPFVDFVHVEPLTNEVNDESLDVEDYMFFVDEGGTMTEKQPSEVSSNIRTFTFGMFGGTMGMPDNKAKKMGEDITIENTLGLDLSSGDPEGSGLEAYKRAIDIASDKEYLDFDILFLPAINLEQHSALATYAINMVESRGDAIVFMDAGTADSTVSEIEGASANFDSSYASVFAPWLLTGSNALIPPTSAFANAIAVNDRNYQPWYSLIGIERGQITGVSNVTRRYNLDTRDELVLNNINPIAKYKGNILIFGTETLQQKDTLLSKYPIRRLLIEAKERISDIADFYIGKQFTQQNIASLNEQVNNILSEIQDQNGLNDFSVEFDTSPDLVDRGIVNGAITLQPTTSIKGVVFTFKVTNTGVEFDF